MSVIKPVDVSIMGREFTVSCTDEERQGLLDAVNYLDKKMHDIRDSRSEERRVGKECW